MTSPTVDGLTFREKSELPHGLRHAVSGRRAENDRQLLAEVAMGLEQAEAGKTHDRAQHHDDKDGHGQ